MPVGLVEKVQCVVKQGGLTSIIPTYNTVHVYMYITLLHFEHHHMLMHLAWPNLMSKLAYVIFPSNH